MTQNFTKKDLKTGDIVVLRNGELGVVILDTEIILYQNIGFDDLDLFSDTLESLSDGEEYDIVSVYSGDGGPIGFYDYKDGHLVFDRDGATEPEEEEPEWETFSAAVRWLSGKWEITNVAKKWLDINLLKYPSMIAEKDCKLDRSMIRIPGTQNLYVLYNKYYEQEQLDILSGIKDVRWKDEVVPVFRIPEENVVLHCHCIICRMDANMEPESLQEGDEALFSRYLCSGKSE